jgi:hypothetical protein
MAPLCKVWTDGVALRIRPVIMQKVVLKGSFEESFSSRSADLAEECQKKLSRPCKRPLPWALQRGVLASFVLAGWEDGPCTWKASP